ncbi:MULTISPECIES: type II secretion system F family protein [unclassified Vibrio]|uniref:Type II secretion system F family protein n=1 Tax=Vibrio sp. HB236076 TaxID=3232307 RepID=A0AB39HCD4_9VIBR|nr:type II secretion system F family protein [Vibrio sp. HB161653]MDP5254001.1 type II secretion system F family protein [Vibrio sp. HB161653]
MKHRKATWFEWQGFDRQLNFHQGRQLANNEQDITRLLAIQGITVHEVKKRPVSRWEYYRHSVRPRDRTQLIGQLTLLLQSGLALLPSLKLLKQQQTRQHCQQLLQQWITHLENGCSFSQALQISTPTWPQSDYQYFYIAEQTGQLDLMCQRLAKYYQGRQQRQEKLAQALRYPLIVLSVALLITYLMLTKMVPTFAQMFAQFDHDLPWLTMKLLAISGWATQYSLWGFLAFVSLFFSFKLMLNYIPSLQRLVAKALSVTPLLNNLMATQYYSQLCATLAITLSAGIALSQALKTLQDTVHNPIEQEKITAIVQALEQGHAFSTQLTKHHFPDDMIAMVELGENSGDLAGVLTQLAKNYQIKIEQKTQRIISLIEPTLILGLGALIAFMIMALYMPIFNLMNVII